MPLPDLDDLIAEVDRTCDGAHRGDGAEQPDRLALLTVAARIAGRLQALADDLVEDFVEHCRLHGHSWADIGSVLGVTRQAAQQRFLAPHTDHDPGEFAEELRRAMTHMKELAVRHRNNYIGTEHLLWGLMTETNSATRLLGTLGISRDDVRRSLRARLSMGASHAAARIAWTPYSRKALATARDLAAREEPAEIRCAHLLAGLVRLGRGAAATVLSETGLNATALMEIMTPARTRSPEAGSGEAGPTRAGSGGTRSAGATGPRPGTTGAGRGGEGVG